MTLYAVIALGGLDIIIHIYLSGTDVLMLALRRVLELSATSIVMMGTGAK